MTWHSLDRSPYGSQFSLKTGLLPAALLRVECRRRGRAWRTSDTSAAASSPHQMQPDPQIDVQAYAPDRILERTFPTSPGRALHHLSSLWKDMGKKIKTWAELTAYWSHGSLRYLHLRPLSDLILRGWLWWRLFFFPSRRNDADLYVWGGGKLFDGEEQHCLVFNLTFI